MKFNIEPNVQQGYSAAGLIAHFVATDHLKSFNFIGMLKLFDKATLRKILVKEHKRITSEIKEDCCTEYYRNKWDHQLLFSIFEERCKKNCNIIFETELLAISCAYKITLTMIVLYILIIDVMSEEYLMSLSPDSDIDGLENIFFSLPSSVEIDKKYGEKFNDLSLLPINSHPFKKSVLDDILNAFKEYFKNKLEYLSNHLRNQPITDSYLYIETKLNEIQKQEIYLSIYDKEPHKWLQVIKLFLELESDYLKKSEKISSKKDHQDDALLYQKIEDQIMDKYYIKKGQASNFSSTILNAYTYKKYNSNLSALTDMLVSLKKNKFISDDTDLKEFRKIFHNTTPENPVKWVGNISELVYFVKLLHNDFKHINPLNKSIWRVTSKIFVDINNNPFEWSKFRNQKNPAKIAIIESCVSNLN